MGKHDMAEPMNQALERHYKDRIKELEMKLSKATTELEDERLRTKMLRTMLDENKANIIELEKSLVKMTVMATTGRQV